MYVTTFYSFKGGVGRSLALVNVGVALARSGRRVLLADFDLHAPGIHTFDALKPPQPHAGIVEYVTQYRAARASPDVREFVYEVEGASRHGGRLWVMPSGKGDAHFQASLAAIQWQDLYANLDGYFMIEDLKAQWREAFQPDYVLIDSLTGHTDVAGICTRQLPDAVVILFFPNEQNLCGLRRIVADIRREAAEPQGKAITLHFVMSNVPDLDDEEQILRRRMRAFKEALRYDRLTATIHHYSSLSLLNQAIFVQDRPRSRLAREYRELRDAIVAQNMQDREAAIRFMRDLLAYRGVVREGGPAPRATSYRLVIPQGDRTDARVVAERLADIEQNFTQDPHVLMLLAALRDQEGNLEEALAWLERAIAIGNTSGAALLVRARIRLRLGDAAGAVAGVQEAFCSGPLEYSQVVLGLNILRQGGAESLEWLTDSAAAKSLSPVELVLISPHLQFTAGGQRAAVELLTKALGDARLAAEMRDVARKNLSLALTGLGRFEEALNVLFAEPVDTCRLSIRDAFNGAMARWGLTGTPPQDLFRRVVDLDEAPAAAEPFTALFKERANYQQCLAVAHWSLGNLQQAEQYISQAEQAALAQPQWEFSCWRYRLVSPSDFAGDCRQIRELIAGRPVRPLFMAGTAAAQLTEQTSPA
jgi:MinD-like ATPase involved in chromosome partitioning or flagellar assembly